MKVFEVVGYYFIPEDSRSSPSKDTGVVGATILLPSDGDKETAKAKFVETYNWLLFTRMIIEEKDSWVMHGFSTQQSSQKN